MAKALTKSQIAAEIATKSNITKKAAAEILESIAQLAYKNAKNTFTLPGLGKLVLVNRKARVGRNPTTGQPIRIPAKRVVRFPVAKAAKDAILGNATQPASLFPSTNSWRRALVAPRSSPFPAHPRDRS